jgi:hypothetical protein
MERYVRYLDQIYQRNGLKENINRSILFECMFCKKKHFHEIKNVPVNEILLELINKSEDSKNSNTVIKYFRQF